MSSKSRRHLKPIEARRLKRGTFGALTGPKLGSTRYEDVEFMKHMTAKHNTQLKKIHQAALKTDYGRMERERRATDPQEQRRRARLFVDKKRESEERSQRFLKLYANPTVRRAVSSSNKRRSDVPGSVNKGFLLGGFVFKSSMRSEAKRSFHDKPAEKLAAAPDPDGFFEPRGPRQGDIAQHYVNQNHSQFKFPLRDYDKQANKAWVSTIGLNSKNWRDRSRP